MSYSSGTFSINTTGQPVVSGTTISSSVFNTLMTDIATGLTTCVLKDGTQTITANIPFANFRLTGLGAGTARTDAAQYAQVQNSASSVLSSVAGTNTITAALTPALTAYTAGQVFGLSPAGTNTGPTTINIDSLGAKSIFSGGAALIARELNLNVPSLIEYDGVQFNILGITMAQAQFQRHTFAESIAGTNTITGSLTPAPTSYLGGMTVRFVPAAKNTGPATLNLNSLGAQNIFYQGAALKGGELVTGVMASVVYDGTQFSLIAPGGRVNALTFTRDTSGASGDVAYTGVGFCPRGVIFLMAVNGTAGSMSVGIDDGTRHYCIRDNNASTTDTWGVSSTTSISALVTATTLQEGIIKSFDADGFTITWTKTSTPGASTMQIFAFSFA